MTVAIHEHSGTETFIRHALRNMWQNYLV